jgi:uncharacterized protein YciI
MTKQHFAIYALDKLAAGELRESLRASHRAYIRAENPHGVVTVLGGPLVDEHGRMNGTLLVVEAQDIEGARAFLAGDPYFQGGLFERVDVRSWQWGLGAPEASAPPAVPSA